MGNKTILIEQSSSNRAISCLLASYCLYYLVAWFYAVVVSYNKVASYLGLLQWWLTIHQNYSEWNGVGTIEAMASTLLSFQKTLCALVSKLIYLSQGLMAWMCTWKCWLNLNLVCLLYVYWHKICPPIMIIIILAYLLEAYWLG